MSTPTPEQLAKLPKWAQAHIARIERTRDDAIEQLGRYIDDQTPSSVYYEAMGSFDRKYIQSRRIVFQSEGVELTVMLPGDSQRGIELSWGPEGCHGLGDMCFIPTAYQQARITNMAYTPNEYERLVNRRDKGKTTGDSDE
jgi:hypothetical protein